MTVEVVHAAPTQIDVIEAAPLTIDVVDEVIEVEVETHISQPQIGGMFIQFFDDGSWTIWFEDGE